VGHNRSIADPDAIASMHPICPQTQRGPRESIGDVPISPATKLLPRRTRPCST
jgi:hypothetical protein